MKLALVFIAGILMGVVVNSLIYPATSPSGPKVSSTSETRSVITALEAFTTFLETRPDLARKGVVSLRTSRTASNTYYVTLLDRNDQMLPEPSSRPIHIKIEPNGKAEVVPASEVPGMAGESVRRRIILPPPKQ